MNHTPTAGVRILAHLPQKPTRRTGRDKAPITVRRKYDICTSCSRGTDTSDAPLTLRLSGESCTPLSRCLIGGAAAVASVCAVLWLYRLRQRAALRRKLEYRLEKQKMRFMKSQAKRMHTGTSGLHSGPEHV